MKIKVRSQKSEVRSKEGKGICVFLLLFTFHFSLFTVLTGCRQKVEESGIRKALPKKEDTAPLFSLQLTDGKKFKLEDVKGKVVLLNFFASWCHPCRAEAPVLQEFYAKYKDRVVFVGIAIEDKEAKVKAYAKEFGIQFPVGIDSTGNIAEAYKIYGIPKTFVIDREGRFSYILMGEINREDLMKEIEKALK